MILDTALTKEKKFDEFLPTMTAIFTGTRWIGIPVYCGKRFLCLTALILLNLISIEVNAIWRLIRAFRGFPTTPGDDHGITTRLSGAIFYANTLISLILMWRFVRTWKKTSVYWLKIETKNLYVQPDHSIKRRLFLVTSLVTFCACVEHGLSMVSATGLGCPPSECFKQYILNSHRFLLHPDEYSLWVAIPIFITSLVATIQWNFQDLVIILMSMGLASRYHRLNLYVKRFVERENRPKKGGLTILTRVNTWRKLREAYIQQAKLVRKVDKELGALTILCNLNNFFFICLQLFFILRKSDGAIFNSTYYIVSFGWLVFRASSVVLFAADVNLLSQKALTSIYKCTSSGYNIEIKRLIYLLTNDKVCLTGLGLFFMNRHKLLDVAAAIVKYEVILMNYDT